MGCHLGIVGALTGLAGCASLLGIGDPPSAPPAIDGATEAAPVDHPTDAAAAASLSGLGQPCGQGLPSCPANAPACVTIGTSSYCSPGCLIDGTSTTDANGYFGEFNPALNDATCLVAFTGTVGTPNCHWLLSWMPMDSPLQPTTTYSGIEAACAIFCGDADACPAGMTCRTDLGSVCTVQ